MLRQTPTILDGLLADMDDALAGWKPSEKRWSIHEVLGHLAHIESGGFRGRLEAMLREDSPLLPGIDPDKIAAEGVYTAAPARAMLEEFRKQRGLSLALLETLDDACLSRDGIHGDLGPITIGNLLHEWPLHDLGHVRQIVELLRAGSYYPHIGPWRQIYKMNP